MGVPVGTPVNASSASVANATASAVLPAVLNKTAWLGGMEITGSGSTAGAVVTATVAGVVGGPLNYTFTAPAGVLVGAAPLIVNFDPPVSASGTNQAITVSLPALGAGSTNATVVARGFYTPPA